MIKENVEKENSGKRAGHRLWNKRRKGGLSNGWDSKQKKKENEKKWDEREKEAWNEG